MTFGMPNGTTLIETITNMSGDSSKILMEEVRKLVTYDNLNDSHKKVNDEVATEFKSQTY